MGRGEQGVGDGEQMDGERWGMGERMGRGRGWRSVQQTKRCAWEEDGGDERLVWWLVEVVEVGARLLYNETATRAVCS